MKYTEVLGLRKPAQDEYYNVDDANYNMDKLDGAVAGTYAHSKGGTVHALTGAGSIIKFTATTNYADGDTWTVNGAAATALTIDGQPLHTGDIIAGSVMLAVLDGGKLQFQFRSYDAQLSNKVQKTSPQLFQFAVPHGVHLITGSFYTNAIDEVIFHMTAIAPQGIPFVFGQIIANFPEGFKPIESTRIPAIYFNEDISDSIIVNSNGEVSARSAYSSTTIFCWGIFLRSTH